MASALKLTGGGQKSGCHGEREGRSDGDC